MDSVTYPGIEEVRMGVPISFGGLIGLICGGA